MTSHRLSPWPPDLRDGCWGTSTCVQETIKLRQHQDPERPVCVDIVNFLLNSDIK